MVREFVRLVGHWGEREGRTIFYSGIVVKITY